MSNRTSIRKRWRRYWTLIFRKKYRKKLNRKYKIKIRGRGFGNGFNFLYSFGKVSAMRSKKNYTMVKLQVPKRVTLPNGRTFVARNKRIRIGELPPNIVMRRTYT